MYDNISPIFHPTHFLLILQGLPGSGKTVHALAVQQACQASYQHRPVEICAIADYFASTHQPIFPYGSTQQWANAHAWNEIRVRRLLKQRISVIVDHSNIQAWEVRPYVNAALQFNVPVIFERCEHLNVSSLFSGPPHVLQMQRDMQQLTVNIAMRAQMPIDDEQSSVLLHDLDDEDSSSSSSSSSI